MKTISIRILSGAVVAAVTVLLFVAFTHFAHAQSVYTWTGSDVDLEGWAWSSNIGWISMNCATGALDGVGSVCGTSDYGVSIDNANGLISGYAWSSNIGWVRFGSIAGCPAGTCDARIVESGSSLELRGWARVCSVFDSGCSGALAPNTERGGWEGWISLSCINASECSTSNYRPIFGNGSMTGNAYMWENLVIGWTDLSGVSFDPPCSSTAGSVTSCSGNGPGSELVTVTTDVWCRETTTRATCTFGCDDGPPAQCITNPTPNVTTFEPDSTVVRVGDTVTVDIDVTGVLTSCVVLTIEGNSSTFTSSGAPDYRVNTTWTSPALTGATTFTLECDGTEVADFTVQVIPISTEI